LSSVSLCTYAERASIAPGWRWSRAGQHELAAAAPGRRKRRRSRGTILGLDSYLAAGGEWVTDEPFLVTPRSSLSKKSRQGDEGNKKSPLDTEYDTTQSRQVLTMKEEEEEGEMNPTQPLPEIGGLACPERPSLLT
jgi:hypothetical protein